jgi:hypothetical protein
MLLSVPHIPPTEEKLQALEFVLSSHTFTRSDQLKAFLDYVCRQEIAGKGGNLNEYLIGVVVLGRPEGYSTGDDSTVRSRAHALRRKLQEFYTYEMPSAPVRIDLPKGSYCPRFVAIEPDSAPTAATTKAAAPAVTVFPPARSLSIFWILTGITAAIGLFLAGFYFARPADPIDPVLREAWGRLLAPNSNVLVCVATAPHLLVRQYAPGTVPGGVWPVSDNWDLAAWYSERQTLTPENRFYYLPHHHSPLWGDMAGAVSVVNMLSKAGATYQVIPERTGEPFLLRDRDVILLGRPEFSRAAALLLDRAYYRMDFDKGTIDQAVWYTDPGSSERKVLPRRKGFVHGLVTVLKSDGATSEGHRTVVISGVNSAGAQAAAEYFASAGNLRELQGRLRDDGYSSWPQAWQVVIEVHESKTLPLNFSYVTHRVLQR